MRPGFRILLLLSVSTLPGGSQASAQRADTIYYSGPIITVNDRQPIAEAVAVRDGRIIAVGGRPDVLKHKSDSTTLIDIEGHTMLPGFVDSHGHTYLVGLQATTANLLPPPDGAGEDIASLQQLLTDWAANNSQAVRNVGWIAGFGYDDSQLAEQRHPTRHSLAGHSHNHHSPIRSRRRRQQQGSRIGWGQHRHERSQGRCLST
jgi:predicted amidohydrolase YtcJ